MGWEGEPVSDGDLGRRSGGGSNQVTGVGQRKAMKACWEMEWGRARDPRRLMIAGGVVG